MNTIFANPPAMSATSAIMKPSMLGGEVWRGFKSIDTTPTVVAKPAPTSVLWDGAETVSPIARPELTTVGWLARALHAPIVLAAALVFQSGCASSLSYVAMDHLPDGSWTGQVRLRSECTDQRQPPNLAWLEQLRRTCSGRIIRDDVAIRRCDPCSSSWDVLLVCRGSDPLD